MAHHEMRALVGKMQVARVSGTDLAKVEAEIFRYALGYRGEGDVTVQRQERSAPPNPDGKWYWKRHALFAALPAPAGGA